MTNMGYSSTYSALVKAVDPESTKYTVVIPVLGNMTFSNVPFVPKVGQSYGFEFAPFIPGDYVYVVFPDGNIGKPEIVSARPVAGTVERPLFDQEASSTYMLRYHKALLQLGKEFAVISGGSAHLKISENALQVIADNTHISADNTEVSVDVGGLKLSHTSAGVKIGAGTDSAALAGPVAQAILTVQQVLTGILGAAVFVDPNTQASLLALAQTIDPSTVPAKNLSLQ